MPDIVPLPADYASLLVQLIARNDAAQHRASQLVNQVQARHDRHGNEGWRSKAIENLKQDQRNAFNNIKTFSSYNLNQMHAFAEVRPEGTFVQHTPAQLPSFCLYTFIDKLKFSDKRELLKNPDSEVVQ